MPKHMDELTFCIGRISLYTEGIQLYSNSVEYGSERSAQELCDLANKSPQAVKDRPFKIFVLVDLEHLKNVKDAAWKI